MKIVIYYSFFIKISTNNENSLKQKRTTCEKCVFLKVRIFIINEMTKFITKNTIKSNVYVIKFIIRN